MLLIGTVHIDIEGPKRLEYLLNKYAPKKITLEVPSGHSIDETEGIISDTLKNVVAQIRQEGLLEQITQVLEEIVQVKCYELATPVKYAKRTGAELYLVDHPKVFALMQKSITEDLGETFVGLRGLFESIPNAKNITAEKFRRGYVMAVDEGYQNPEVFAQIFKQMPKKSQEDAEKFAFDVAKFAEEREQFMADEISRIQPDVHVGGIGHVFEEFAPVGLGNIKPLYQRLARYSPEKVKLCEAAV